MQQLNHWRILTLAALVSILMTASARAGEDAYFDVAVDHLTLTAGTLPKSAANVAYGSPWSMQKFQHYVVLDGPGEAYSKDDQVGASSELPSPHVVIHTPDKRDVTGRLYVSKDDDKGMVELKFKIPASEAKPEAKVAFYTGMENHYEALLMEGLPGAAWFRYRARQAREARVGKLGEQDHELQQFSRRPESLDDTFSLFSGNQALAENLQLDKALPPGAAATDDKGVDVDTLPGITVAEMDWKSRIQGKNPALDPLAAAIPSDQHALFFHNFESLIALADEADRNGTPVLQYAETQSADVGTRGRYERQLGISLNELGRLLGTKFVGSIAITGSDPYLRSGSDLAILFEPKEGNALQSLLLARIGAPLQTRPSTQADNGKAGSLSYTGARSPDRGLCSYVAVLNNGFIVVSNSPAQLARLAAVQDGKCDPLSKAPEYIFFRDRYKLGDANESALLVLSDATIRRWCSARWRIGDSRRTRAAAVLADLNARNLDALAAGKIEPGPVYGDFPVPELGQLHLTPRGAASETYGTLDFMTPIAEMDLARVYNGEAEAYQRWRQSYQTNWRGFFDPIAVRFQVSPKKLAVDLSVLPLIVSSDYGQFVAIARGAKLDPATADLHDCVFLAGLALNNKSALFKEGAVTLSQLAPNFKVDPLSWVGGGIWFIVDHDPIQAEIAAATQPSEFIEKHISRLPVAVRVEVVDGFKLAAFLVAAHAFIDQSAPGMTVWENLTYKDQPYVKISAGGQAHIQDADFKDIALYYRATGSDMLLTLSEPLLKRAIDRQLERDAAKADGKSPAPATPPTTQPLLGQSLAMQADVQWFDFWSQLGRSEYQTMMQQRSWSNLPILSEWKHRYPDQDPLKLYERFFHAKLVDPAGGQYIWNEQWQTMESTIYGCPAQPKEGPSAIAALQGVLRANLGVTFEDQGLRATTELDRAGK
jgi:hypothetical protein